MYFDNMSMSDESRAQQDVINELEMKKALLQYTAEISALETQIKGNKASGMQLSMQMAQMGMGGAPSVEAPQDIQAVPKPGPDVRPAAQLPAPPAANPEDTSALPERAGMEMPQEAAV
jgi:hypothetical protein